MIRQKKTSRSNPDCQSILRQFGTIDWMAFITLLATPFFMVYLWNVHTAPTYHLTLHADACNSLASVGISIAPISESDTCTATASFETHVPITQFPIVYYQHDGKRQELLVSRGEIITAQRISNSWWN